MLHNCNLFISARRGDEWGGVGRWGLALLWCKAGVCVSKVTYSREFFEGMSVRSLLSSCLRRKHYDNKNSRCQHGNGQGVLVSHEDLQIIFQLSVINNKQCLKKFLNSPSQRNNWTNKASWRISQLMANTSPQLYLRQLQQTKGIRLHFDHCGVSTHA